MNSPVKVRTTEEAISTATNKLATDITTLSAKRDTALSAFRQAATDLDNINAGLRGNISKLEELTAFIDSQRSTASQIIEDNDRVRSKILGIIGE